MTARLIFAIISTLLEEAAIVIIVLWGLPKIEVHIPMAGLITLMVAWATYSVISFQIVSRSLRKIHVARLPDMVGSKGKVVSSLAPEGLVMNSGELWVAKSLSSEMQPGEEAIVVAQDGLKLVVGESSTDHELESIE